MPDYIFSLDTFEITDTRSTFDDTLIAGFSVWINGYDFGPVVANIGDFDNGTYSFSDHGMPRIGPVTVGPYDYAVLVFELFNNGKNGHPNIVELEEALRADLQRWVNIGKLPTLPDKVPAEKVTTVVHVPLPEAAATVVPKVPASKLTTVIPRSGMPHQSSPSSAPLSIDDDEDPGPIAPEPDPAGWSPDGSDPWQPGGNTLVANFFTGGLYSLFTFAFEDCDGFVAGGFRFFPPGNVAKSEQPKSPEDKQQMPLQRELGWLLPATVADQIMLSDGRLTRSSVPH